MRTKFSTILFSLLCFAALAVAQAPQTISPSQPSPPTRAAPPSTVSSQPQPPINPALEYQAALDLVSRERYAEAGKKLEAILPAITDPVMTARATFLAGYCHFQAGAWKEAAGYLETYIKSGGLLVSYARYWRAQSIGRSGDLKTAVEAWKLYLTQHPSGRMDREARIAYAEALIADKQRAEALKVLRALLVKTTNPDQRPRVLFLIGKCYEAVKPADAIKTYRSIYLHYPASPYAAESAKRLKALKVNPEAMSVADRTARAEELYEKAHHEDALVEFTTLLNKIPDKSSEAYRHAAFRRAMCLFRLYKTEEALAAFQSILNDLPTGGYTSSAYYYSGHCFARQEKYTEAMESYHSVIEKTPTSSLVPEAYLNISRILANRGKWDEALQNLEVIRHKYTKSARELDIPWRVGWIEYRRGNYEKSRAAFEDQSSGQRRNDYWAARALDRSGKPEDARGEYLAILKERPYDYYGQLAAARLNAPPLLPAPPSTSEVHLAEKINVKSPYLDRARELASVSLTELAAQELADLEGQPGLSADDHIAIGKLFEKYGDFNRSRRVVSTYVKVNLTTFRLENAPYWKMFYPQAYRQLVTKFAQDQGLDQNLVWAIMLQESNFKPHVVSPAGARGLMQIIIPTAKSIAKRLGVTDFKITDLFDPKLNITFGTTYLGDVSKGFGDHPSRFIMSIASYNGGPQNAHRWQRERPGVEIDEWVEEIPFAETKNYVKKVLGNWAVYQMLYGKGSAQGLAIPVGTPMLVKPAAPAPAQP